MKKWRKVLFCVVMLFVFFSFVGDASAATEKIQCFYQGQFVIVDGTGGDHGSNDQQTFAVGIEYTCKSKGKCTAKYAASKINSIGNSQSVKFENSSNISKDLGNVLYKNGGDKPQCPNNVAVSYNGSSKAHNFFYSCPNGEAANGQCVGVFTKLNKTSTPDDGDTLEDKVKIITDGGSYYHNPGNQNTTPGNSGSTTHDDDDDGETDQNSIDSIRQRVDTDDKDKDKTGLEGDTPQCTQLLQDFADVLKNIFFVICVAGVVILLITMSGDFVKAITSGDSDVMADAFKKSLKRIISTLILLLLPVLLNFVIDVINNNVIVKDGEVKIGNISDCNIYD